MVNQGWALLLFGLVGLASGGLLFWGWRRVRVRQANPGIVLGCLVWTLLMGMGWFSWHPQKPLLHEAVLLTEGADWQVIRNLLKDLPQGVRVFALPAAPKMPRSQPVTHASDTGWLRRHFPKTATWHLVGWGLDQSELDGLGANNLVFHASQPSPGFRWVDWSSSLILGQQLTFRAVLNTALEKGWRARLVAPSGESVAELQINPGQTEISLHHRPTVGGPLSYQILLEDPTGAVRLKETVSVFVDSPKRLEVWFLMGSPRFEIKFLKHWLGEAGNRLLIRTRFTETDWQEEAINREPIGELVSKWPWHEADVIIADAAALAGLNPVARQALRAAVIDGLGLFLFADGLVVAKEEVLPADLTFFTDWQLQWQEEGIDLLQVQLRWRSDFPLPIEKIDVLPAEILLQPGQQVLMDDGFGGVIAAVERRGRGMVATSLVRQSQRWIMLGQTADFRAYWSQIMSQVSRPRSSPPSLLMADPVFVDTPSAWTVWAGHQASLQLDAASGQQLAHWETDRLGLGRRNGIIWPNSHGWQKSRWNDDSLRPFYVYPAHAWHSVRADIRSDITETYLRESGMSANLVPFSKPFPSLLLMVLFTIALSSGLWLGEKLERW